MNRVPEQRAAASLGAMFLILHTKMAMISGAVAEIWHSENCGFCIILHQLNFGSAD